MRTRPRSPGNPPMQAEDAGTMAGQATSGKATRVAASHGRAAHAHASHAHATHGQATRWQDTPLHAGGRTLVEASAGTGKTWTIAVLYLRLLLEQGLLPRQIVVTTFSDAAAQELRERIRARLVEVEQWACRAAAAQEPSVLPQDPRQSAPDHAALVGETLPLFADSQAAPTPTGAVATVPLQAPQSNDENAAGSDPAPDRAWALARWGDPGHARSDRLALQLALAELDHAPIGTLHSLCRRILADYPFECGHPFVAGELVAAESMHAELVDDCWRRLAHASEPLDFGDAQWWCAGRGNLAQHL